tara:strand:- start:494 stop:655 length:162 start_codon:yes stop_codon:yes gene_type:complete
MKKRKLNSKNPRYTSDKSQLNDEIFSFKKGTAKVRSTSGKLIGKTVEVRAIWY